MGNERITRTAAHLLAIFFFSLFGLTAARAAAPNITSLSPTSVTAGGPAFTLTINGANFVAGSTANWGTTALATAFVSATKLTASVPASLFTAAGTAGVTVTTTGGTSTGAAFTVNLATPTVTTLSPSTATAGGSAFTLTINGSNFVAGTTAKWGTTALATTFVSVAKLTAAVPASLITAAGTVSVMTTTACGISNGATFTVNPPPPTITSLSPATATAGGAAFTLTINGANFAAGATAKWGTTALATTFVSSTQLTATIPANLIAAASTASVTVTTTGGASAGASFTVRPPLPTITSVSPTSATAGGAAFTLTINGTNFVTGAAVKWGTTALTTTLVSATQLTAAVPASLIATASTASVTVTTAGGTSGAVTFTVKPAAPTITSLSPNSATAGGAAFTLTINGTNFVTGAAVKWGTTALTTTLVSATQLTAAVPASLISAASTASVTVTTASGTSAGATFTVNPANTSVTVANGSYQVCAVTLSGGVKCWGVGPLGNDTTANSATPVDVTGLTSGVRMVVAGSDHNCALTNAGGVKCWGINARGELGDGTNTTRLTPVDVTGLTSGVHAIGNNGSYATCALLNTGGLKCWGDNTYGGVGDGTNIQRNTPVDVVGLTSGVQAVSSGSGGQTCALTTAGAVKCWGYNAQGQVGDGTTTNRNAPVSVTNLSSGVQAISAGYSHSCALTVSGGVKCWGDNRFGELGSGQPEYTNSATPVDIAGLTTGVKAVAAGGWLSCAITATGGAKCWGRDDVSQLGDGGNDEHSAAPVDVSGLTSGVQSISGGMWNACAVTTGNFVKCWGDNSSGQIGDGSTINRPLPSSVIGFPSLSAAPAAPTITSLTPLSATVGGGAFTLTINGFNFISGATAKWSTTSLATTFVNAGQLTASVPASLIAATGMASVTVTTASGTSAGALFAVIPVRPAVTSVTTANGFQHTCAVSLSGGVKCWGNNDNGQLGDGTTINRATPVDVSGLTSGVRAVVAGYAHSCALTNAGGVKCWGEGSYLGDGTSNGHLTPVDVVGLTQGVQAIGNNNSDTTCALLDTGGVKCWGGGEVGDGTNATRYAPVDVVGLASGVQAITSGMNGQACALTTAGAVKCWGVNANGQVGDGTTISRSIPVSVVGLSSGVQSIVAGYDHTCALTTSGGVKCWGDNSFSELGDGTTVSHYTPVDAVGLTSGVKSVTAGGWFTCVVTLAGGAKCWGRNDLGELGAGSTVYYSSTPIDVSGLTSGVQSMSAGYIDACAVTTGNFVKCWGDNRDGQVGDGSTISRSAPVTTVGYPSITAAPPVPTITSFNPIAALVGGNAFTLTINGFNFVSGATVKWGTTALAATFVNSTQLTAAVPASLIATAGTASVTVATASGTSPAVAFVVTPPPNVNLTPLPATANGFMHTCAVTLSGGVKCWGTNSSGQLGDGTTTNRSTPVDVAGLTSGVRAVVAGYSHSCALTNAGGVKCWGDNGNGYLGDGTGTARLTPVDVMGLTSGVLAIANNSSYVTCALTSFGGVKCWGDNTYGGVGDGTNDHRYAPVDVVGLTTGAQAISSGTGGHTCVLTLTGGVKCWGYNANGQVGDGTTTNRNVPVNVSGLSSGVQAISAGLYHTCALTTGGGVKCWGDNEYGALGVGSPLTYSTPVGVTGLTSGVKAVAAGGWFTCVVTLGGGAKCWGRNDLGELGNGGSESGSTPTDVSGLTSGVQSLSAGSWDACAVTTSNVIKCWGQNAYNQVGDGTTTDRFVPTTVGGFPSSLVTTANGYLHTCDVGLSGGVRCWGSNSNGQLGDGTKTNRSTPVAVAGLTSGIKAVVAGYDFNCVLTTAGGVKCWGGNDNGQLGDGTTTDRLSPVNVTGLTSGVQAIAANTTYSVCALLSTGGVKCWGANEEGELGDGTTTQRMTPVDVTGLTGGVQAITNGGGGQTCALTTAGAVKCWGSNNHGQVGDGTTTNRTTPVNVTGLSSGVQAIAAGFYHTCALTTSGGIKCWGDNMYDELGSSGTHSTPADVVGLTSGVKAVVAGFQFTCAVLLTGEAKCWGAQLGVGSTGSYNATPTEVSGLASGVQSLSAGYSNACAVTTGNAIECWGANSMGQVGDGTTTNRPAPVSVAGN